MLTPRRIDTSRNENRLAAGFQRARLALHLPLAAISAYLAGCKSESHPKELVGPGVQESEREGGDKTPGYEGTRFINPCPFGVLTCSYTTWSGSFATYLCREKMPSRATDTVRFFLSSPSRGRGPVPSAAGPRALGNLVRNHYCTKCMRCCDGL